MGRDIGSYSIRRVNCSRCGVKIAWVPWADAEGHSPSSYRLSLVSPFPCLCRGKTTRNFGANSDSIEWVEHQGVVHRQTGPSTAIEAEEIASGHGHQYRMPVCQIGISCQRLEDLADRTETTQQLFCDISQGLSYLFFGRWIRLNVISVGISFS